MKNLRHCVKETESVEVEVRESLQGLVDQFWIDEYLETRLTPIRDELAILSSERYAGQDQAGADNVCAVDED